MTSRLLIIGHVWPEPQSSAAGSRMMQLIEGFQKENYEIVYASACAKSDNAFDLSKLGIVQAAIEMNHSSFDCFVKSFNPDVVVFDRFLTEEQYGWRVSEQCPNALKILDTEDLHCLRKGRHQAFKDAESFNNSYLFNDVSKREIASIYRCDVSLIISEVEMTILQEEFMVPNFLLFYLPFQLDSVSEDSIAELPDFNQRKDFVTIGNFLHEPNYNAVLYLKESIWPLIRQQLPKAQLYVYGAYASQKVTQLHQEASGFLVKGYATDVPSVMKNAKVCLAPLRFGAGLKGKLIDAMLNGTPCAMSSIAAEGMFGNGQQNGCVEDDPQVFAEQAVHLYNDETLWQEKQGHGFNVIKMRFNKKLFHNLMFDTINSTIKNLMVHRQKNFTGQMLQYHMFQSTKYMSRWIELKNQ